MVCANSCVWCAQHTLQFEFNPRQVPIRVSGAHSTPYNSSSIPGKCQFVFLVRTAHPTARVLSQASANSCLWCAQHTLQLEFNPRQVPIRVYGAHSTPYSSSSIPGKCQFVFMVRTAHPTIRVQSQASANSCFWCAQHTLHLVVGTDLCRVCCAHQKFELAPSQIK